MGACAKIMNSGHELRTVQVASNDDFYTKYIDKSDCKDFFYNLQACQSDTADWRKCKKEMEQFKKCMAENSTHTHEKSRNEKH